MKLSVGILTYSINMETVKMTNRCWDSLKGADEEIIVENGGGSFYTPDILVNYYTNQGFTKGINTILRIAGGDYIACISNDTYVVKGDIRKLCIKDTVTSPQVINQDITTPIAGCFFVIPRTILDKVGYLDESMRIYYSDQEYIDRLNWFKIPMEIIDEVGIFHEQAKTVNITNENSKVQYGIDKKAYDDAIRKYGLLNYRRLGKIG